MVAGRRHPREDHGRPRHRRAAPAAGRPRRAHDRRPPRRPARRDAAAASTASRSSCASSTRSASCSSSTSSACADDERERFERAFHQAYGAVLVDRPDRLGQVDVALRGARAAQHAREEHHHDRGPGRVPARRASRRSRSTRRPGLTFANGLRSMMRADPDIIMVGEIRDARDGADRRRVRAHRPPRPLDAAHQRRADGDHAPDRDGHRAVPRRLGDRLRRRPAPGAHAVPALQAAARSSPPHVLRDHGFHGPRRPRGLRARRLRALRRHRLQGPHRPLRGDDASPTRSAARRRARAGRRDRRGRDARGHAPPARRRA